MTGLFRDFCSPHHVSSHLLRTFTLIALTLICSLAVAAEPSSPTKTVTVSLDADLIAFFKAVIWLGGIFLALYALIGVVFFGWDVAKARASLNEAQKEVKEQLKELRQDYREMKELKERLEELGARLQEEAEASAAPVLEAESVPKASLQPAVSAVPKRSDRELIREVIASSNYEWTTIGRIIKKTGLSREDILREARADSDIVIGYGSQTRDHLFKFKHAN